jgi:hypothetical protein
MSSMTGSVLGRQTADVTPPETAAATVAAMSSISMRMSTRPGARHLPWQSTTSASLGASFFRARPGPKSTMVSSSVRIPPGASRPLCGSSRRALI